MDKAPSLSEQRRAIGLDTPSWEAKKLIWARVQCPTAQINNGYKPTYGAREAHRSDSRGVAVSGGWRAGKSLYAGMEGVTWLPYADLIWLVARDYDLTRQEFSYLAEAGISTGLVNPKEVHISLNKYQPCALRSITGCVVETRTLADFRKLAARPPDLVIVCEPGLIDNLKQVMELLWGRVSEKRGCIILAGTSDEANEEWYEQWERWNQPNIEGGRSFSIPTWQNRYRYPLGRNEREFKVYEEMYGTEALMAHYGGVPASPRGLVLRGYFKYGLHVDEEMEFDPGLPIEVAIDPNYSLGNRYVVEAVQWHYDSPKLHLVDEVAAEGLTHDEMRALCEAKPWWRYVQGGTIDPFAGETHIFGSPAPVGYWKPVALRLNHRPRVNTTVQALKEALAIGDDGPRMTLSPRCERFIYEATRWRQEKSGKPSSHLCDALKGTGYWLVDHFGQERLEGHDDGDNIVQVSEWTFDA